MYSSLFVFNFVFPSTKRDKVNIKVDFEGRKSYFKYSRRTFLVIIPVMLFLNIILVFISLMDVDFQSSIYQFVMVSRGLSMIIGPLITFIFYLSIFIVIFYEQTKRVEFKNLFEYVSVAAIGGIVLAITLNTRSITVILSTLQNIIPLEYNYILAIGIVGPIIEETAKSLPIYIMMRGLITQPGYDHETRIYKNGSQPIFMGLLSGLIFNLLESYWYIVNSGYLYDLNTLDSYLLIVQQLVLRSLNPLHFVSTSVIGYGIALILWNSRNNYIDMRQIFSGIVYYFIAIILHGIWNSTAVYGAFHQIKTFKLFIVEIPLINILYLFIYYVILIYILYVGSQLDDTLCPVCNNWHAPPYDNHEIIVTPQISLYNRFLYKVFPQRQIKRCNLCKQPYVGDRCENPSCKATRTFVCTTCNSPVPAYATECWNCKSKLDPPFNHIFEFRQEMTDKISLSVIYIMAGFYVPTTITLLIMASHIRNSINDFDKAGGIIAVLAILSLVFIISIVWSLGDRRKAMGISIARNMLSMYLIEFALLLFYFGAVFALNGGILTFFLISPFVIALLYFAIQIGFTFRPLFHG